MEEKRGVRVYITAFVLGALVGLSTSLAHKFGTGRRESPVNITASNGIAPKALRTQGRELAF